MTESAAARALDVICLGRAAVDFYGHQIGGRLEEMQSFAKYVGGSSANVAIGLARLGVRAAMLTRVGDEHMGRFVRETLARERVDVSHVRTDPRRLTGFVILGIRARNDFPHIFFRENCADMGLEPADFDAAYVASSRALAVTGTHLSTPSTAACVQRAIEFARTAGTRVILDIDYRPVLWGLTSASSGDSRYVASAPVTAALQAVLPACDLIVGTEEEIRIAGGCDSTAAALRAIRERSRATIVLKLGASGCEILPPEVPASPDRAICVAGFAVEVLNSLGAGDAFLAGFLAGWLRAAEWAECGKLGNACGALVVSRHGCAPALPSRVELEEFLGRAAGIRRPDLDERIAHLHLATTTRRSRPELYVLAFDHRRQFEQLAGEHGAPLQRITRFKELIAEAVERVAERTGTAGRVGVIVDDRYGESALNRITAAGRWVGRPVEIPGSRPVQFEPRNHIGLPLLAWPATHVVKCLVYCSADDPLELRLEQEEQVLELYRDTVTLERELLLEVIAGRQQPLGESTVAEIMRRFYNLGVRPAWWKLQPQTPVAWQRIAATIGECDPYCNGVLLLGLDAPEGELRDAFAQAAPYPICRGFAVGRSIFGPAAREWMGGRIDDERAIDMVATSYERFVRVWQELRNAARVSG